MLFKAPFSTCAYPKTYTKHLCIGDEVEVGPGTYSTVLLFTHANAEATSDMILVASQYGRIAASPSHSLMVNGELAPASSIIVGDRITAASNGTLQEEPMNFVKVDKMSGLYNPQTTSRTILVHYRSRAAMLASTYATAIHPAAAQALDAP